MLNREKKITKATFKSFIKKNQGNLYLSNKSSFDGRYDCVMDCEDKSFRSVSYTERHIDKNLGIDGVWLVGGSDNYFKYYEDDHYMGIEVYNCCRHFILATYKG